MTYLLTLHYDFGLPEIKFDSHERKKWLKS